MVAIFSSYPDHISIDYIDDSQEIKKSVLKIEIPPMGDVKIYRKPIPYPNSMFDEDKNRTLDKIQNREKRRIVKKVLNYGN